MYVGSFKLGPFEFLEASNRRLLAFRNSNDPSLPSSFTFMDRGKAKRSKAKEKQKVLQLYVKNSSPAISYS